MRTTLTLEPDVAAWLNSEVARTGGMNAIAVAIPCHRVVASARSLGGFHLGTQRKKTLLAKEADGGR